MRTELTALPWVLARPRVVAQLDRRWDHRVVAVVAGAGFGKSTALALATSADSARGEDHYVRLDATCTSVASVMGRLRAACGDVALDTEDPATFAHNLGSRGEHCLIFDDVHEIGESGAGVNVLRAIVDALMPSVHVVLASRRKLPVPLARRRAAGHVLDLGESDLAYTEDELRTVADLTDTAIEELLATGGWPALVSLTVRQGHHGALEYLAEEIVDDLDAATTDALMVASLAGGADPEILRTVAHYDGDPHQIASSVPLVTIDSDGTLVPHALWSEALQAQMLPDAKQQILRALTEAHRQRGDHGTALQLALQLSDPDAIAAVVRELCAPGHIGFDVDDIDRWLRDAPSSFHDCPEGRLLHALSARRCDPNADTTKEQLADCAATFGDLGDVECEIVALSELALVYRWRGEADQLPVIIGRLFELEAAGHAAVAPMTTFARAAIADQMGDTTAALDTIKHLRRGDLHDSWIALVEFLRCHELLLLGRPREAHDAAVRSMELGPPGYAGGWCAERSSAWHLGVNRDRVDRLPIADEVEGASVVDRVWIGSWFGAMQALAGRLPVAARNVAAAERALHAASQPELIGFVAWAKATLAVAEGDVATGRAEILGFLAQYPVNSPVGTRFAARAPALVDLVAGGDLDAGWRDLLTGPWQRTMLEIADLLRALRTGQEPEPWPDPSLILCALPVPWAVELAVRGDLAGVDHAAPLARLLVDVAGADSVQDVLDHQLDAELRAPAGRTFGAGGSEQAPQVRMLGPVTVTGPDLLGTEELRRLRVRELLAYIALAGPVRREVVATALWPDHDRERSAANMRVNLSYLGRIQTANGQRLVIETERGLTLADGVGCDVADFDAAVADAAAANRAGYGSVAVGLYERALKAVGGPPLTDTRETDWFDHEADRLTIAVVRAATAGAAVAAAVDEPTVAIDLANRAITLDPYHEEAWVTLIGAHQAIGDEPSAADAATQLVHNLDDLGIQPSSTAGALLSSLGVHTVSDTV